MTIKNTENTAKKPPLQGRVAGEDWHFSPWEPASAPWFRCCLRPAQAAKFAAELPISLGFSAAALANRPPGCGNGAQKWPNFNPKDALGRDSRGRGVKRGAEA